MSQWNVLHAKPRCEKKIAEFCAARRLEHYLPLRSETKVYQRRKVTVQKPVFPGYIFVAYGREERTDLLQTNHVVRILEPVNEALLLRELDQVRMALAVDATLGACAALKRGLRVRITGGPFLGIEGVVETMKGEIKVLLNVEMIGRAVPLEVDRLFVEPID